MPGMTTTGPTLPEIERIAGLAEPVVRNLQITQCYHELALAVRARLAGSANWCTFATWASKQAGLTIRGEDLGRELALVEQRLRARGLVDAVVAAARAAGAALGTDHLQAAVWRVVDPQAALARAGDAVARGNLKVFAEIAPAFARFTAERMGDDAHDEDAIASFCDALRPGDPPEGQAYLRRAFAHYYHALFETDARVRAELVFLANLEVGFHEQTRLQPEIAEALDAAGLDARTVTDRLVATLFPRWGWLRRLRHTLAHLLRRPTPLERAVGVLIDQLRLELRHLLTGRFLTLGLPNGARLRLGSDLRHAFPDTLRTASSAELVALLRRIDPTPDSAAGSGAADWADLGERLHFICDFFRSHHERADLFEPPFSPAQTAALKAGRRPAGAL